MKKTYFRGEMYYADLGTGVGSEQNGYRPVVVIQNDVGNKYSPTTIVAAISAQIKTKAKLPTHFHVSPTCGLAQPSVIMLEQIRTIDKTRLDKYIGKLSQSEITGLNHALVISVGLMPVRFSGIKLCLCSSCADKLSGMGFSLLQRNKGVEGERKICSFCGKSYGDEYEVDAKKHNDLLV